jgi:hypothetical protein
MAQVEISRETQPLQITLLLSPPLPLPLLGKGLSGGEAKNTIATNSPPLPLFKLKVGDRGLRLKQAKGVG